jgi:HK97 gp10 family phage protein
MAIEMTCDVQGAEEFQQAIATFDSAMQEQVRNQLLAWSVEVQAEAMRIVPVRTGRLRDTIYAKVEEWVAEVGAEAAYAMFVEFGTRYMRAAPFLYPAVQNYLPMLEQVVCEAIDTAKMEAGLP